MTTPYEDFVNIALGKALSSDVTLPTADKIPVFTGIGRQVTGKTKEELGLALTADLGTAASANVGDFDPAGSASTAQSNAQSYADGLITSVYKVQGSYNPQTTGNFPTSANTVGSIPIKQAFIWLVSGVSGQYTFQGVTVNNGDTIVALIDNPSATTSADWHITEANLGYTPENQNNKDTDGTLAANSDTKYPSQKAVKTYADTKQAALGDVITANTYGSSTQYPVLTVNAKGIVTGITLQTVQLPTFTDATFAVQKNGSPAIAATWSLSAFTASHIHTYPDKDINFGNLSFIATTASNNLSGTGCHVIGGSGNSVSGTDNIAIGCIDNVIEGDGVVALSKYYTGGIGAVRQPRGTTILGTSLHPTVTLGSTQSHYGGACAATLGLCTVALTANGSTNSVTTDGATPANSNTPYLVEGHANAGGTRYAGLGGAVHDIDFIISFGVNAPLVPSRTFFAKRRVYAALQIVDGTPTWYTSTEVVGTDANLGTVVGTVTIGFTLDTANNRLVPTVSATGGQRYQVSARVNSHYNRK